MRRPVALNEKLESIDQLSRADEGNYIYRPVAPNPTPKKGV